LRVLLLYCVSNMACIKHVLYLNKTLVVHPLARLHDRLRAKSALTIGSSSRSVELGMCIDASIAIALYVI
jgi:hypothetical protein